MHEIINKTLMAVALVIPFMTDMESDGSSEERCLEKEVVVKASLDEMWRCWTTSEGIASFFSSESKIELRLGGPYELYMGMTEPDDQGKRGSEGCKVLSFIPKEMLSFEWNFPPKVPSLRYSGAKTHVVLQFEEVGEKVRVRFRQFGWQEGEDWDRGYEYFDRAWSWVFDRLKKRFEEEPGSKTDTAQPVDLRTWVDGSVTVISIDRPMKRQDFEITVSVPLKEVWRAIATTAGLREYISPKAKIELAPHGKYSTWVGATNKVLSYAPYEMLSTSGSAPPRFPNVRKGGTWSAYFLEPLGENETKLRLCVVGWKDGAEWDEAYDYFLKNNAVFLNMLHGKLTVKAGSAKED